jgi:hypothetical protein
MHRSESITARSGKAKLYGTILHAKTPASFLEVNQVRG